MKYYLMVIVSLVLCLFFSTEAFAQIEAKNKSWRWDRCKYQTRDREHWSKTEVKLTIDCAVEHWGVQGGRAKAFLIAKNESGFNWCAQNPTSSAGGVYQALDPTWRHWVDRFRKFARRWNLSDRKCDAQSHVLYAIRVAHGSGWYSTWCKWTTYC